MNITPGRRALDKIYKRRNRYEIPDWQRGEVWDLVKKQQLIDSILRGWRLPKLYFVVTSADSYEVVDGQQRLSAIYEFFGNELPLSEDSARVFGGPFYSELPPKYADAFDDFEIDYDEIQDATDNELKQFFQRLQAGLPLTSSEKLNAVHSRLRDFCRRVSDHKFIKTRTALVDSRLSFFDVMSKVATLEIEGIDAGLRFDDVKSVFDANDSFVATSAVAKRISKAMEFLAVAFPRVEAGLKNRTIVQSVITLACQLVATRRQQGLERKFAKFIRSFLEELSRQVELGQAATDLDYIRFQRTVSANLKTGARTRNEILLRKAFLFDRSIADAFGPMAVATSGIELRVADLGEAIAKQIGRLNSGYAAKHGHDLFKSTNKTTQALVRLRKPIKDLDTYRALIDDLYFVFKEGVGARLEGKMPDSFTDVNILRTDLQHDLDHGNAGKAASKRRKTGTTFRRYAGTGSPDTLETSRFVLVQANLLTAIEADLLTLSQ